MNFINAETVHSCITYPQLMDGLLELHREGPCVFDDMLLGNTADNAKNFILIRAAFQNDKAIGVKMASVFSGNTDLPSIQAVFVLFDGSNGSPVGLIDGESLTHRKTAADSALGSRLLSRPDSRRFLMVGAGSMSPHLIKAHIKARPSIDSVTIWNRSPARAQEVANSLKHFGITAGVTDNLENAVRAADIVCSATMSVEPVIQGDWLKPGAHLDLVGAYRPDMREADDRCLQRATIFVDSRKTTIGEIGEIEIPLQSGVISTDEIIGDFYDLCREDFMFERKADDITLFKNGGGGHLDLMTARLIHSFSGMD